MTERRGELEVSQKEHQTTILSIDSFIAKHRPVIDKWPLGGHDFPSEYDQREIHEDLIRLVDVVRATKGQTMVFLDRSARPMGWMLRKVWHRLQENGMIPDDESLPEVRFMASGREQKRKYLDGRKVARAVKKYRSEKTGPILIVDDTMGGGGSAYQALEVSRRIWPDRIKLVHAFSTVAPFWYIYDKETKNDVLGIVDRGDHKKKKKARRATFTVDKNKKGRTEEGVAFRLLMDDIAEIAAQRVIDAERMVHDGLYLGRHPKPMVLDNDFDLDEVNREALKSIESGVQPMPD